MIQRQKKHVVISAAIIVTALAFVGLLAYGLKLDPKKIPPTTVDKAAHPFRVSFIQGQQNLPNAPQGHFTLDDMKGKLVVLNFWASWCVSCREEAAELERYWQENKDEVLVIGIAIQDEKEAAIKFASYYGKTYTLGLDEDGKAAIDYGVSGVPETFLIDKTGVVRHKEVGPVTAARLKELMQKLRSQSH